MVTNHVNGKKYVGKTSQGYLRRWLDHRRNARSDSGSLLGRAIMKYGPETFSVRLLYEAVDERECFAVEKGLIAEYGTLKPHGYNICIGGQGASGRRMTPEQRDDVSQRMLGNTNGKYRKGLKATPEQRQRNSEAQKKLTISAETRAKMAATMRGQKRAPSVGRNISLAKKGKPVRGNYKAVICVTNDTIYQSVKTAALEMGMSVGAISWALSRDNRTAGGHHFVYAVAP